MKVHHFRIMKIGWLRNVILIVFLMSGFHTYAQVKQGFESLKEFDFFKARKLFVSSLKKDPAAANYGLAQLHFDNLNHFHSLDSAYKRIQLSENAFQIVSEKKRLKYLKYQISDSSIKHLKSSIYTEAFKVAGQKTQPQGYETYISSFPGSPWALKAVHLRDSFALVNCILSGKAIDFEIFLQQYPTSEFRLLAEKKLDRVRYEQVIKLNSVTDLESFLLKFPNSAFVADIENALYRLQVIQGTQEELYRFVKKYPNNINTPQAWELLYAQFTSDQRTESYANFKIQFPEFPFQEKISNDFKRARLKLFPVVENELWGFADSTGKVLIPYQFNDAEYFSENLALVQIDGKKGFINKNGFRVIAPNFKEAETFANGLAIVETESASGIINTRGEWIVKPMYYSISGPYGNFYRVENGEKYGVIDRFGNAITEVKYDDLEGFTEGKAAFALEGLAGFIDTTGKEIIPAQFEEAGLFVNGIAKVMIEQKYGLINSEGKFIVNPKYARISNISEGLFFVSGEKKCGYIDSKGTQVIKSADICAGPVLGIEGFQEGLARIERKGKVGFIDKKGKLVVPANLEQAGYFSNGLAPFRKKKKWGYINKTGKVIIEPIYDNAFPFQNGKARVKKNGKIGMINKEGKLILEAKYDEITEINGFYLLSIQEKKCLFDQELNVLLDCNYDDINRTEEPSVFQLIIDQKMAYYHSELKQVFWEEKLVE
jgi:hypothetical protein